MHTATSSLTLPELLDAELAPYIRRRAVAWAKLVEAPSFKNLYAHLLVQTYHYVKHSCPLMELALSKFLDGDQTPLQEYLRSHIEEELNHDQWLLSDLEGLGYPREVAMSALPLRSVVALVGTQLYLIENVSPLALFGYIYVLEAYPPRHEALRKVSGIHGIPPASMSTFLEHSDRDVEHRKDLIRMLEGLSLSEKARKIVLYSAVLTGGHVADFLEELILCFTEPPSAGHTVRKEAQQTQDIE